MCLFLKTSISLLPENLSGCLILAIIGQKANSIIFWIIQISLSMLFGQYPSCSYVLRNSNLARAISESVISTWKGLVEKAD